MAKKSIIKILNLLNQLLILAIVFFVPLFFAGFFYTNNFFELPKMVLFKILTLLLLLVYILKVLFQTNEKLLLLKPTNWIKAKPEIVIPFVLIFILACQTFLFSINTNNSFFGLYDRQQGLISLVYYFLFFFLLVRTIKPEWPNRILLTITISSFFVSLYGIAQRFGWDFVSWTEPASLTHRIFSTQGQPIFLASYLVMVFPVSLYLFFYTKSRLTSVLYFFTSIVQIAALLLTYSFGGVIGLGFELVFIFLFLFFYLQRRKKIVSCHPRVGGDLVTDTTNPEIPVFAGMTKEENAKSKEESFLGIKLYSSLLMLLILLSSFVIYNVKYDWALSSKIKSLIDWQGSSAQMRTIYWQASLSAIKDRPWFGYGLENQEQVLTKYYDKQWAEMEFVNMSTNRAHNIFLDIMLTSGLLGLTLFLLCLYFLGKIVLNNWKKNEDKILSAFLGIAVLSLLLNLQFSFLSVTLGVYSALFIGILLVISENTNCPKAVIPTPHTAGEESLKGESTQYKRFLPSVEMTKNHFLAILGRATSNKLMAVMRIVVGCGAIAICIYLINLNFNKIINDSYFREMLANDQGGDFFAVINLYDYIKANNPKYNYYDQQLIAIVNNDAANWSNPGEKIAYIKDRLEEVIKNNPAKTFSDILVQARTYAMMAIVDKGQEDFNRSKSLYEEIIRFSPGLPEPQYELAVLLARAKDYNGAKAQYLVFLSKLPDLNSPDMNNDHRQAVANVMIKGYISLGDVCVEQKDWTDANKYYQQVIVLNPKNPFVYYKIARLFYLQHDFKQAIWYNNKASELDPSNYFYPYITAVFYKEMGDKSAARNYVQQALKLNPKAPEVLELVWELGR